MFYIIKTGISERVCELVRATVGGLTETPKCHPEICSGDPSTVTHFGNNNISMQKTAIKLAYVEK